MVKALDYVFAIMSVFVFTFVAFIGGTVLIYLLGANDKNPIYFYLGYLTIFLVLKLVFDRLKHFREYSVGLFATLVLLYFYSNNRKYNVDDVFFIVLAMTFIYRLARKIYDLEQARKHTAKHS
jgi:hypothetical protein